MRVVHDAQDVAERVHHRGGDKAIATVLGRLQLCRPHRNGLPKLDLDVIDMPIDDDPGPTIFTLHPWKLHLLSIMPSSCW